MFLVFLNYLICVCSMSYFVFFIRYLFIVSWIWLQKVMFKKVCLLIHAFLCAMFLIVKWQLSLMFLRDYGWCLTECLEFYTSLLLILPARTFFNSFREDHEMMHLRDLQKLEGVLSPSHLRVFTSRTLIFAFLIYEYISTIKYKKSSHCYVVIQEMEFAHSLRQSKVNIKICQVIFWFFFCFLVGWCVYNTIYSWKTLFFGKLSFQYSYELLLQFLHKSQSTTMLGIINEHINFQGKSVWLLVARVICLYKNVSVYVYFIGFSVSPGQPSSISDDAESVTLTGSSQDSANQINQKEIHWGVSQ